jgi:hypothetical protein
MAGSEEFYGPGHEVTFTKQPPPATRRGELSEIAHHKDGDSSHGFSAEIDRETPGSHDHSPDA